MLKRRRCFERAVHLLRSSLEQEFGQLPRCIGKWCVPALALLAGIAVGLGSRQNRH